MTRLVDVMRGQVGRAQAQVRGALRAVLSRVQRGLQVQLVDAEGLSQEQLKALELFQQFGFTSAPPAGTQAIVLPLGGRTSAAVVIATEHGSYRFALGADGEACVHNQWGDRVHLKADRSVHVVAAAKVQIDAPAVEINTQTLTVNASASVALNTPLVAASADLTAGDDITAGADITAAGNVGDAAGGKTMSGMRAVYNAHVHDENNTTGPTDTPTGTM